MGHLANRVPSPRFDLSMPSISGWMRAASLQDPQARLQVALLLSLLVHALVVTCVGVRSTSKLDATSTPLMVDIVNARTETAPKAPDILAQANLDGGGSSIMLMAQDSGLAIMNRPSGGEPRPVPVLLTVRRR